MAATQLATTTPGSPSAAAATARATSCLPTAGRSRRRSRPIRAHRPATRPRTSPSPRSCSRSRAGRAAPRITSTPSGGRRECSAWSASAETGSECRPRSSRTERWPGYPASARVWTACGGRSTLTSPAPAVRAQGRAHGQEVRHRDRTRRATPRRWGGSRSPTSSRSPTRTRRTAAACSLSPGIRPTCPGLARRRPAGGARHGGREPASARR